MQASDFTALDAYEMGVARLGLRRTTPFEAIEMITYLQSTNESDLGQIAQITKNSGLIRPAVIKKLGDLGMSEWARRLLQRFANGDPRRCGP
jgi:hypothetical protein